MVDCKLYAHIPNPSLLVDVRIVHDSRISLTLYFTLSMYQ